MRGDGRCAIMHDKFIVVDTDVVEEGSFNYTAAAERKNAENVLVLHDRTVAQEYSTIRTVLRLEEKGYVESDSSFREAKELFA